MVFINENSLSRIVRSYRAWGRACWCASDEKNPLGACGVRFNFNVNGAGYDHKYMYSHVGYNLKPLEMQAAMGLEQIKKLPGFIKKRKENFRIYEQELSGLEDQFILPKSLPKSNPCWFAFPLTIRSRGKIKRAEIVDFLEKNGIDTRPLFSGNIVHQQAYKKVKFRIAEPLDNSDRIMLDSFFVGIYPGLGEEEVKFVCGKIREFCARKR
jgi:CDP-6-deoxy-D-xylo-4-hexulose-3-dehydrase